MRNASSHGSRPSCCAGQYVDPSDRTTVQDYARSWVAARIHRYTTARRVSGMIETPIAGTPLGSRRLAAVTPSEVQAWASDAPSCSPRRLCVLW